LQKGNEEVVWLLIEGGKWLLKLKVAMERMFSCARVCSMLEKPLRELEE